MSFYGAGEFYFGFSPYPQVAEAPTFWGSDENNYSIAAPYNLTAYQNVAGQVVLYWSLNPIGPLYPSMKWIVETDTVDTFSSGDLLTYDTSISLEYIDGCVNKGISVPTYSRLQGSRRPMYWRVKGVLGDAETLWSSSIFYIPEAIDDIVRQAMLDRLNEVVYKKDFSDGESNLNKIYRATAQELDVMNLDTIFANNANYAASVRDVL